MYTHAKICTRMQKMCTRTQKYVHAGKNKYTHAKICTRTQKYVHARTNMYTQAKICTRTQKYVHARTNMYISDLFTCLIYIGYDLFAYPDIGAHEFIWPISAFFEGTIFLCFEEFLKEAVFVLILEAICEF